MNVRLKTPNTSSQAVELTHDGLGRPILIGLAVVLGMKVRRSDVLVKYSVLHWWSAHCAARISSSDRSCNNLRTADTKWRLDFNIFL